MSENSRLKIFIYISIIIVFVIIAIYFIINANNCFLNPSKEIIDSNYSKINNYLKEYQNYNIEILRQYNNILYGSIIDENNDPVLFSTYAIFSYDTVNDTFDINILDNDIRIIDYIVLDDTTYFCTLQYDTEINNSLLWKIFKQKSNFRVDAELLLSGNITDVFDFPMFNYISKDRILVATKYFVNKRNLKYELLEANTSSNSLATLINDTYIPEKDQGSILYNSSTIKIYNNKIYYSILNSDSSQCLISYNLANGEKEKVFTNDNNYYGIFNFIISNKYIFIQLSSDANASINLLLDATTYDKKYSFKSKVLTFPNLINNEKILFHSSNNKWDIFQLDGISNSLKELNIWKDTSVFPKYILTDNNTILLQTFDNIFYEVKISNGI